MYPACAASIPLRKNLHRIQAVYWHCHLMQHRRDWCRHMFNSVTASVLSPHERTASAATMHERHNYPSVKEHRALVNLPLPIHLQAL